MLSGVAFFVAAERCTAAALSACDLNLPASVTGLCALGVVAAVPSQGILLQRALGPAAAWMRAVLPCTLVPAFLFPAVCELPESSVLPKLALFGVGGVLATIGVTGYFAGALASGTFAAEAASCAASTSTAAAVLSSPWTALGALGIGGACTAALSAYMPTASDALKRAPSYVGATVALYVVAARGLPPALRKVIPANVGCAIILIPSLLLLGGKDEIRTYLDVAGSSLLWSSQPAMVTLGLYVHTHRSVMARHAFALAALATIVAPTLLFGLARAGHHLGLAPEHVASLLPASTTTGLALTWPGGMPLIRQEWVAAGTAFYSGLVQVTCPLLLALTRLKTPFGRGVAIGSTAHVGGMVALMGIGEAAAADAAAVALVIVGVARSVLIQVPFFSDALATACGADEKSREN